MSQPRECIKNMKISYIAENDFHKKYLIVQDKMKNDYMQVLKGDLCVVIAVGRAASACLTKTANRLQRKQ
jgi:hypothetical protein